jgi:hypothetical protein
MKRRLRVAHVLGCGVVALRPNKALQLPRRGILSVGVQCVLIFI